MVRRIGCRSIPTSAVAHLRSNLMSAIKGCKTTYEILKAGAGAAVAKGNKVTVHATGTVKETQKKFWCVSFYPKSSGSHVAGCKGSQHLPAKACATHSPREVRDSESHERRGAG